MASPTSLECPTTGQPCPYRVHLKELYQPVIDTPIWQPPTADHVFSDEFPEAVRPELDGAKLNALLLEHGLAAKVINCAGVEGPQGEVCPTAVRMADSKPRQGLRAVFRTLFARSSEVGV